MAINFPNSPAVNDTFTVGSVVYTWDGTSWNGEVPSTGGVEIDEIIESYKIATGQTITAGKFVNYINEVEINGSKSVFSSTSTQDIKAVRLTDTKALVAFYDGGNSDRGTCVVLDIVDNTISFGSKYVFNNVRANVVGITRLSDTKAFIAFTDTGNSNFGTGIIANISGTEVTYGSKYVFQSSSFTTDPIPVLTLNSEKVFLFFPDASNSSRGVSIIATISGNVISYSSKFTAPDVSGNNLIVSYPAGVVLEENKIFLFYAVGTSSPSARGIIANISGTIISYGTLYPFVLNEFIYNTSTAIIRENLVAIGYRRGTTNFGEIAYGSISGNVITFSPPVIFAGTGSDVVANISLTNLDKNRIFMSYRNSGTLNHGSSVVVDFSDVIPRFTSIVTIFNPQSTFEINTFTLSKDKILSVYKNSGDSSKGEAIVQLPKRRITTANSRQFLGVSNESGISEETIEVYVKE